MMSVQTTSNSTYPFTRLALAEAADAWGKIFFLGKVVELIRATCSLFMLAVSIAAIALRALLKLSQQSATACQYWKYVRLHAQLEGTYALCALIPGMKNKHPHRTAHFNWHMNRAIIDAQPIAENEKRLFTAAHISEKPGPDNPLWVAAHSGDVPLVELLLQKGSHVHHACRSSEGHPPLLYQLCKSPSKAEVVLRLLQADPSAAQIADQSGRSSLWVICKRPARQFSEEEQRQRVRVAQALIAAGTNLHETHHDIPLFALACMTDNTEIASLFLAQGVDANTMIGNIPLLFLVCIYAGKATSDLLHSAGACCLPITPEFTMTDEERSLLMIACREQGERLQARYVERQEKPTPEVEQGLFASFSHFIQIWHTYTLMRPNHEKRKKAGARILNGIAQMPLDDFLALGRHPIHEANALFYQAECLLPYSKQPSTLFFTDAAVQEMPEILFITLDRFNYNLMLTPLTHQYALATPAHRLSNTELFINTLLTALFDGGVSRTIEMIDGMPSYRSTHTPHDRLYAVEPTHILTAIGRFSYVYDDQGQMKEVPSVLEDIFPADYKEILHLFIQNIYRIDLQIFELSSPERAQYLPWLIPFVIRFGNSADQENLHSGDAEQPLLLWNLYRSRIHAALFIALGATQSHSV